MLTARYSRKGYILVGSLLIAAILAWAVRHAVTILSDKELSETSLALIWIISFLALAWQNITAFLEKPYRVTISQIKQLSKLNVAVLVPVYNEDPAYLQACLQSMLDQKRRPNQIHIVDDGSNDADYSAVIAWVESVLMPQIKTTWTRTSNKGKRHAQVIGMQNSPDADIYLTVDSDTILEPRAISEGLKPFVNPKIQSVAGVLLPLNNDQNFLTRFSGTYETAWQLVDRSSQSLMRCVTVNSGPLALYRAETIRQYMHGYLNETFMDRPVHFSDDSLLTTYALYHGQTVQQPTALCFSAVPDNVNHHIRRYVRWMRGSFIRSFWRFRYLKTTSYVWWLHVFKWFQMALGLYVFFVILIGGGFFNLAILPYLIGVPIGVAYLYSLRYLTIKRSDQSNMSRFYNFLLAPVALLWMLTVMRVVKWYGYATCYKTGWGTRAKVEVRLRTNP